MTTATTVPARQTMSIYTMTAARLLGVSGGRVRQLIYAGTLRAERMARDWKIDPNSLDAELTRRRQSS